MLLAAALVLALAAAPAPAKPAKRATPAPASLQSDSLRAGLAEYQELLTRYIRHVQPPGAPMDTRLDYEQIYVDDKIWTLKHSARLDRIHAELMSAKPSKMTPAERTAWGINTYNFLAIEQVTDWLLIPGLQFTRYTNIDDIILPEGRFFTSYAAVVESVTYDLPTFERRFVRGDTTAMTDLPKPLADPRLLFATNPGRIGLPLLMPRAYRADSLDRQLDAAVRATLALPRFLSIDAKRKAVVVSSAITRSQVDLDTDEKLLALIRRLGPPAIRAAVTTGRMKLYPVHPKYDMLLNQVAHPKVIVKGAGEGGKT